MLSTADSLQLQHFFHIKATKIVVTRTFSGLNIMRKMRLWLMGSATNPAGGAYSAPPDTLAREREGNGVYGVGKNEREEKSGRREGE